MLAHFSTIVVACGLKCGLTIYKQWQSKMALKKNEHEGKLVEGIDSSHLLRLLTLPFA